MRLDELRGRRVALLGLGADVLAAVPHVRAADPAGLVLVEEGRPVPELSLATVTLAEAASWAEVFVRSPGFPRYQQVLLDALDRGAEMTTPLDLWVGTHGPGRTVVGVTGTKGKSTVTDLVGVLAHRAGLRVGVAGNLGVPVFDETWDHDAPIVVLEVSSYQAADLHHVPDLAVLTFLSEDHLSWHGGRDRYESDKLRLLRNDGGTAERVLLPVSGGRAAEAVAALGVEVELIPPPEGDGSAPRHRLQNAALAAEVLLGIGGPRLSDQEVVEAARSSLRGRLDACPGPEGLLCLDDALASNPSATAAGLAWLRSMDRPTVVLLGGADRGVDPSPLVEEAARWPAGRLRSLALADNGHELAERCAIVEIQPVAGLTQAVRLAVSELPADGVLIFSPAAPTPPEIGNWETRSDEFRAALAELR